MNIYYATKYKKKIEKEMTYLPPFHGRPLRLVTLLDSWKQCPNQYEAKKFINIYFIRAQKKLLHIIS